MKKKLVSFILALVMLCSLSIVAYGLTDPCEGGGGGDEPAAFSICLGIDWGSVEYGYSTDPGNGGGDDPMPY